MSNICNCLSVFQAPYKAVLISLYEDAVQSDNEKLKEQIKRVIDLKIENMPEKFRELGLDDSLVLPSYVVNTSYLLDQIDKYKKKNPDLKYHADNEEFLKNITNEIQMTMRNGR